MLRDDSFPGDVYRVTVVSAFPDHLSAVAEAERLRQLAMSTGRSGTYTVTSTKFYPQGRTVGPLGEVDAPEGIADKPSEGPTVD